MMSIFKSPISMAVLVAFFYILTTWALYTQWETTLPSGDMSGLLKVLLFPVPLIVSATNGGVITFWFVFVQGILLGAVSYFTVKARLIKKG